MFDLYLVTACRNAAATIDETVESVVSQAGGGRIRYHVQDGASTDGTPEALAAWEKRLASDVLGSVDFSYASEPDSGLYHALGKGFEHLHIPPDALMGWLNADDILLPGAAAALAGFSRAYPHAEWLTGCHTIRNAQGAVVRQTCRVFFPREVLAAGLADGKHWPYMQQESTFWRKRLYDRAGGLDRALSLAGDWDLWRRFAREADLIHLRKPLGAFTQRPGQLSENLAGYLREVDSRREAAPVHGGTLSRRGFFHIAEAAPEGDGWRMSSVRHLSKRPKGWYALWRVKRALFGGDWQ